MSIERKMVSIDTVKFRILILLFLGISFNGHPQTTGRSVFAFIGIRSYNATAPEIRLLENRIITELVKLGSLENFSLVTPKNRDLVLKDIEFGDPGFKRERTGFPAGSLPNAGGIIAGGLSRLENSYQLHIEIIKSDTLETVNAAKTGAPTFESLLEAARSVLFVLFDLPEPPPLHAPVPPGGLAASPDLPKDAPPHPAVQPDNAILDIVGLWKGDKGLENIEISRDGSAVANLGGWNIMHLMVTVSGNEIIIRQNEPNSPKLYMNSFPYSVAVQIAEAARPMRWIFTLSKDKQLLSGIKETTFFHIDRGKVVSADNSYSREAVWLRIR